MVNIIATINTFLVPKLIFSTMHPPSSETRPRLTTPRIANQILNCEEFQTLLFDMPEFVHFSRCGSWSLEVGSLETYLCHVLFALVNGAIRVDIFQPMSCCVCTLLL